ncbi:MAG TPA: DNA internalization-related competence protein ComEC/Rec2 [Candidatus Limnocylindria bacterium]|nr:DNA internalization-related competence protein ComEC/Rec2 [Candidatus Limnocylindria bacterium]
MAARQLLLPALAAGVALGILGGDAGAVPAAAVGPTVGAAAALVAASFALRGGRRPSAAPFLGAAFLVALSVGLARAPAARPADAETVDQLMTGAETVIAGTVVDDPRPRGERQQVVIERVVAGAGAGRAIAARVLVWLPRTAAVAPGDRIRFTASLQAPQPFEGFDYAAYLGRQGIVAVAYVHEVAVTARDASTLREVVAAPRHALLAGLLSLVPEPEAALGAGILLGVRSGIAPEIEESFAAAGLTHVVAISGWNIAIVAGIVATTVRPLRRLRGGRASATLLGVGVIAWYVMLAGATPSVVRAALMAGAILLARLAGSRAHAISALLAASLAMLLAAPAVLWDVGFQLSVMATAGLIWLGDPIARRLSRLPAMVREPVALTLAAQLTTLPIVLGSFERLSLVAPLANVLVVPLVPLAMAASAAAAAVGALEPVAPVPVLLDIGAWWAGGLAWLLLAAMTAAGKLAAGLPFASVSLAAPGWLALAWYAMLVAAWALTRGSVGQAPPAPTVAALRLRRSRPSPIAHAARAAAHAARWLARPTRLLGASAVPVGILTLATLPDGRLHLTALDVGQGDAIVAETDDGTTLLVDGGPDPDVTLRRLGAALPFWQRRIDVILLSHPHQDHIAGLIEVLARHRVGLVVHAGVPYDNPAYARFLAAAAAEPGGRLAVAHAGTRIALGPRTGLEVLYPSAEEARAPLPDGDINNASIVAVLRHDAFSVLLTGDAEAPVETRLAAGNRLPPADVLKVGHHGSESSTTPALLEAVAPRVAVISCGRDNEYGHPSSATLDALASAGPIAVLRTDRDGAVEVTSDGARLWVHGGGRTLGPIAARGATFASGAHGPTTGSIAAWLCPTSPAPAICSPSSSSRRGSSATPRESARSRPPPPGWLPTPESRWTSAWSRPPPSSTTWTSPRSERGAASTASSGRRGSPSWDTRSSGRRWPRTRSGACSTTSASRAAGHR